MVVGSSTGTTPTRRYPRIELRICPAKLALPLPRTGTRGMPVHTRKPGGVPEEAAMFGPAGQYPVPRYSRPDPRAAASRVHSESFMEFQDFFGNRPLVRCSQKRAGARRRPAA
eukprot:3939836-Rhodomonas_salina.1